MKGVDISTFERYKVKKCFFALTISKLSSVSANGKLCDCNQYAKSRDQNCSWFQLFEHCQNVSFYIDVLSFDKQDDNENDIEMGCDRNMYG